MGDNNVYIRSEEFAWIPARLVEQNATEAKVAIPQYEAEEFIASDGGKGASGFKSAMVKLKDYQNKSLPLQNVGPDGCLKEVDDMVDLPYLHEVCYCLGGCVYSIIYMWNLFLLCDFWLIMSAQIFVFTLPSGCYFVQLEEKTHRCQTIQSCC